MADAPRRANVVPTDDSAYNLGSDSVRWSNVYADTLHGDGAGITGSIGSQSNVVYVNEKGDFPSPSGGVITLAADTTYLINTDVDLTGDRISCPAAPVMIAGRNSETSSLTSTGLGVGVALVTATRTLVIQNITFKDVDTVFDIDGTGGTNVALDWLAFNISNVPSIGTIQNIDNNIWTTCAILDSGGLVYTGNMNTVAFTNSLVSAKSGTVGVSFDALAVVSRRIRATYSAFIAGPPTATALDVNNSATIPIEGYILDTANFGGGGTFITGYDHTDNETLFTNCVGITNSREISNYYMNGNTTATTISASNTPVKAAGSTASNTVTQKFTNTDNRATYVGAIARFFKVTCTLSVESGNNQQVGVYLAKNGSVVASTEVYGTTSGNGRAENIVVHGLFELAENDYVEVWVENASSTSNITVTELNLIAQ